MLSLELCKALKAAGWPRLVGKRRLTLAPIDGKRLYEEVWEPTEDQLDDAIMGLIGDRIQHYTVKGYRFGDKVFWAVTAKRYNEGIYSCVTQGRHEAKAHVWLKLRGMEA